MAVGSETEHVAESTPVEESAPEITVCESCPGKSVFLEADNSDGWIASDQTIEVTR